MSGCPFSGHPSPAAPPIFDLTEELRFLDEVHQDGTLAGRKSHCRHAIDSGLPAPLTARELTTAARIAWRNNSRCIGRLHWRSLRVRDRRHLSTAPQIAHSLLEHLHLAQSDGRIRSIMTVFAPAERPGSPAPRIWNHQLCGYAGYKARDGSLLGDPKNETFTRLALDLGWTPPATRSAFDLLPWIIAGPGESPRLFPLPPDAVQEVPITHPHLPWFADLGLRWYAVPVLSDMLFHAAGTDFPAAPFNGWYMSTEIAARDLTDTYRYDILPLVAARLGLDTSRPSTLWQDRALLEVNLAVLHSYEKAGVRMVDHHTASDEFIKFLAREKSAHREVSARWDWIVPPMSPATTPVFHMTMREHPSTPDFRSQTPAWQSTHPGSGSH